LVIQVVATKVPQPVLLNTQAACPPHYDEDVEVRVRVRVSEPPAPLCQ